MPWYESEWAEEPWVGEYHLGPGEPVAQGALAGCITFGVVLVTGGWSHELGSNEILSRVFLAEDRAGSGKGTLKITYGDSS